MGSSMGRGGESRREDGPLEVYLKGKVVDVTKFARTHPGGAKVFRIFQNRDATEQFEMYHSPVAHKKLDLMMKGARDAPKEAGVHTTPMGLDFQKLTKTLHAKGYFAPDYADEVFKLALTLLPGFLGARLFSAGTQCLGSFLIAFSFYLSGWTSHDYLHHGVFKGGHQKLVHFNNAIGYAIGTWQGYSVGWWRARHNTHHVCTNEIGNDPDIKTAPILVFVRNTRRSAGSSTITCLLWPSLTFTGVSSPSRTWSCVRSPRRGSAGPLWAYTTLRSIGSFRGSWVGFSSCRAAVVSRLASSSSPLITARISS